MTSSINWKQQGRKEPCLNQRKKFLKRIKLNREDYCDIIFISGETRQKIVKLLNYKINY